MFDVFHTQSVPWLCLRHEPAGMGLAAETRPLPISVHLRCPPAERLEFAGYKENCPCILASDDHHYQNVVRHTAFNRGHWRVLAALDHHHSLTSKAWNFAAACKRSIGINRCSMQSMPGHSTAYTVARPPDRRAR